MASPAPFTLLHLICTDLLQRQALSHYISQNLRNTHLQNGFDIRLRNSIFSWISSLFSLGFVIARSYSDTLKASRDVVDYLRRRLGTDLSIILCNVCFFCNCVSYWREPLPGPKQSGFDAVPTDDDKFVAFKCSIAL